MSLWDELAAALPSAGAGGPLVPVGGQGAGTPGYATYQPPSWVNAEVVRPASAGAEAAAGSAAAGAAESAVPTLAQLPRVGSMSGGSLADLLARARLSGGAASAGTEAAGAGAAAAGAETAAGAAAAESAPWVNPMAGASSLGLLGKVAATGLPEALLANAIAKKLPGTKVNAQGRTPLLEWAHNDQPTNPIEHALKWLLTAKTPIPNHPLTRLLHLLGIGKSHPSTSTSSTAQSTSTAQMAQAYANIMKQLEDSMAEYMSGLGPQAQQRIAPYMKNDELAALAILGGMQANPTSTLPTSLLPTPAPTG